MARLLWTQPGGERKELVVAERVIIGRARDADCSLPYRGVSRRHACLARVAGRFGLEDLGSKNGTLLNGERIGSRALLRTGDRLRIGTLDLEFVDESETAGAPETVSRENVTEPLSRTIEAERGSEGSGRSSSRRPLEVLPRRVGKFLLTEKLGQGGMGTVYRAEDLDSGIEVAVKFIRAKIGRREAFLEFFHNREAVLAREVDHPNVVRTFEHGIEGDRHYIAMEFVKGENLYRVMKRRRLESREILDVLRQVACGLAAAHRQGVVHSDIKPGNILLSEEGLELRALDASDDFEDEADDTGGILEFVEGAAEEEETPADPDPEDPSLEAEIRRRVGERAPGDPAEILVDPPYFARSSETRFLRHYLRRGGEERGFFLLVGGAPGVGKKRLVSEFLLEERERSEREGGMLRVLEFDTARVEGIPLLWQQVTGQRPGADYNARQMVEELVALPLAGTRPVVIRLLDLAHALPLPCLLIARWAEVLKSAPLSIIASLDHREGRDGESVKTLLDRVAPVTKQLYLRPLTEYQVRRYVETLFPRGRLETLARDLHRLSGGNFTRLLDLLRSFLERGVLRVDAATGEVRYRPNTRELELEEGKNLYERYRAYPRVQQQVLESAAFIGERFFFDVLLRHCQMDETALYFLVRQLLSDGFIVELPKTWYAFSNPSFHRYMAERIPPPDRPHLHRKLTRLLQTVPVEESADLLRLRGLHYAGCREYAKAVRGLLEAAQLAQNDYRLEDVYEIHEEILRIYRALAPREGPRSAVRDTLREWFHRDGNWYEILRESGAKLRGPWVKITDFGISFRASDEERGYAVGRRPRLGTPRYMAPERGHGEYGGPRSDVFALGIIAYEMAAGRPPFPKLKKKKVVEAYQTRSIRLPAECVGRLPPGFEGFLEGMLAVDPDRRWDTEHVIREISRMQSAQR